MKDKVGPCSYAMNQMFPVDEKNFSDDLVLLYESKNSGWNMSGGPDDILIERHKKDGKKGCIVLFANGGRRFIKAEDIPNLRWTVEEE